MENQVGSRTSPGSWTDRTRPPHRNSPSPRERRQHIRASRETPCPNKRASRIHLLPLWSKPVNMDLALHGIGLKLEWAKACTYITKKPRQMNRGRPGGLQRNSTTDDSYPPPPRELSTAHTLRGGGPRVRDRAKRRCRAEPEVAGSEVLAPREPPRDRSAAAPSG